MKVLVTGGAGFIGSHTVDALVERGYDVRVLDNLQKPVHLAGIPKYINSKAEYIWGDIRDKDILMRALTDVAYIFHFAAYQDYLPDFSTFFSVNSVGTALIYEIIVEKSLPIRKIIVASSQFVNGEGVYKDSRGRFHYPGRRDNLQLSEGRWDFTDEFGYPLIWQKTDENYSSPPNQYAISKYSQELMALNLGERYDIPSVALRYSIVQGSRQSFYNAYSGACRIFSLHYYFKKAPIVYEDGQMIRDFVNVHDVIDANMIALEKSEANGQVFCVGGGAPITIEKYARMISRVYDLEELEPKIPGEYRFGDTRHACSDIKKITELGWVPQRSVEDSAQEYKEYLESQTNISDILNYSQNNMKRLNVVRKVKKNLS